MRFTCGSVPRNLLQRRQLACLDLCSEAHARVADQRRRADPTDMHGVVAG
jgi:hypothetical protein